jgi:hypothetical protein
MWTFCGAKAKRVTLEQKAMGWGIPAMEAKIADHVWSLEELVGLMDGRVAMAP